jgi:hypothetical protein
MSVTNMIVLLEEQMNSTATAVLYLLKPGCSFCFTHYVLEQVVYFAIFISILLSFKLCRPHDKCALTGASAGSMDAG